MKAFAVDKATALNVVSKQKAVRGSKPRRVNILVFHGHLILLLLISFILLSLKFVLIYLYLQLLYLFLL